MGRSKKETQDVLLTPKVEKMKPTMIRKVRGSYTNSFIPTLWPAIYIAMKQHRNVGGTWNFLRLAYRKPHDLSYLYDSLSKSSMREWFHSNGNLEDIYKHCVEFGTYFAKSAQHCPFLASYHILSMRFVQF